MSILRPLLVLLFGLCQVAPAEELTNEQRHQRVNQRRAQAQVIVHRGASSFARENTIAAYRIALELGADGNEIDIRATRDGVLVCFHDDMLDHQLEAYGDVADYDWSQLKTFPFRTVARVADEQHIPMLEQVFELHRQHAALMHLDIKRAELEEPIMELIDRMDLWPHIIAVNSDTAPKIVNDPRYRAGQYKGSLYQDRAELNPDAIRNVLALPGNMVIVDDPRGVLLELGRQIGTPKFSPAQNHVNDATSKTTESTKTQEELLQIISDAADWEEVPDTDEQRLLKKETILKRANAADEIRRGHMNTHEIIQALQQRAIERSKHPEWMYHGLDGASALRALAELDGPAFTETARVCLWRVDPSLESLANPQWKTPLSWLDFRTKAIVFSLIEQHETGPAQQLCRDYLALTDDEARDIGPLQFEAAARALLILEPSEATAIELLEHRRQDVRGAAILICLDPHSTAFATWGRAALEKAAPYALRYWVAGQ